MDNATYARQVLYSQDEPELSRRDPRQIRDASQLETGKFYEERCPDLFDEKGKEIHRGFTIRRFKICKLNLTNKWISILVNEEGSPLDVSLADLGVLPYQSVERQDRVHKVYRLNHFVVPVN